MKAICTTNIKALIAGILLIGHSLSAQTILRVNVNTPCTSGCDGSTWALAYPNVSNALSAFSSGEIWVAAGTYKPGPDRLNSFDLKNNAALYGGFNGTETARTERNATTNATILSGDINGNDVGVSNNSDNNYHVLTAYYKTGVVLDGFTVKGGNANISGTRDGGGLYMVEGDILVENCTFEYNVATTYGGAVCATIGAGSTTSATLNFTSRNCTFRNNQGYRGGAVGFSIFIGNLQGTVVNCLFEQNSGNYGGAIIASGGLAGTTSIQNLIKGSTFKNNTAPYGGAFNWINSSGSTLQATLHTSKFMNNSGEYGAVASLDGQSAFINCLFSKNIGGFGGTINGAANGNFTNCTFSGNTYTCLKGAAASTNVQNCIIWNQTTIADNTDAVINYSNIQGGWATGTGNISVDPLFIDATNDNYNLSCTSPCRNVGNNAANAEATDLGGVTRIQETTIDLGAYESDGVTLGVTVANANFAAAIRTACPSCINGSNVLLCPTLSQTSLDVSGQNISSLAGIELFSSLTTFNISNNSLVSLPTLPSSLINLNVSNNSLTSLPSNLPSSLTTLNVANNSLTSLPNSLPSSLTTLNISNNTITCLPTLPNTLATFTFDAADINCLPNIPTALMTLMPVCGVITTHPSVSGAVCAGGSISLTTKATSISPMTIKWQRKGAADMDYSDLAAAASYTSNTTATYTFSPISADNNALYRAVFTPFCSGVTTTAAQLTVINSSTAPATTTDNNSLSFDGTNDCVQIVNCSGAAFPFTDAITIEYWFKGSSLQSAVRLQPDAGTYIVAGWSNKHIISTSGGTTGIAVGAGATNGNWHHIAMTWQKGVSSGFKAYLDGVAGASSNATNVNLPSMTSGFYLGSNNGTSEFMNGSIDEVRVWNVARTQAEIQANMCSLTLPQTGLVMYYKFNHGVADGTNTVNTLGNAVQSDAFTGLLNNFNLSGSSSNFISSVPSSCPAIVLPVEFIVFNGKNTEGGNELTWTTESEVNTQSFEIQRLNKPNEFETLGIVTAVGKAATYTLIDNKPLSGINHYRLKIVDFDAKTTFSKTISVENGKILRGVKVYPNPVSDLLTIENAEGQDIEIVNVLGQIVFSEKNNKRSSFSISHFEKGVYFVKASGQMVKFIKN